MVRVIQLSGKFGNDLFLGCQSFLVAPDEKQSLKQACSSKVAQSARRPD